MVLTAVVLAYCAAVHALAQTLAADNAGLAHRLAPHDGHVTALYAASRAEGEAGPFDRLQADAAARLALRQDPISVVALSTLGIDASVRGDTSGALRLFGHAGSLSRRDLQTQLWTIQYAVSRGDVSAAVGAYDITLRSFPPTSKLLFPVLASASAEPAIHAALVRTLAGAPPWGNDFIFYLSGSASGPRAAAALFIDLHRAGYPVSEQARAQAINGLISHGDLDLAWSYYASERPGVDRERSRDPRFGAGPGTPSALDWTPASDNGVSTSIQKGVVDFAAPPSVGGPLLEQMQLLPPGDYRLVGRSRAVDQADNSLPYWALTCRNGAEIGRVVVPKSAKASGVFAGGFTVPPGCPAQVLILMAQPSDAVSGLTGQLLEVRLAPARARATALRRQPA
ncbi:hypothetical protein [Sphingomonas bacterium]|uniref:hypothetical protein n=1 Tax=Sphingomonas bacterium TaxID=1895847 RepID=UPI0015758090|nr:hypothetical protein [Sphingomonas bacterium]